MKALKKILIILVVVLFAGIAVLTSSLDSVLKKGIETVGPEILGVDVKVDNVSISIIGGSAKISGLAIGNPDGFKSDNAFYLGNVALSLKPLSLFSDTITIQNISIIDPEINYEIGAGKTNISALQNNISSGSSGTKTNSDNSNDGGSSDGQSKKVIIEHLLISGAQVKAGIGGVSQAVPLPEIKLQDIGKEGQAASIESASRKVMSAIAKSLANADLSGLSGNLKEKLKDDLTDKIKSLF